MYKYIYIIICIYGIYIYICTYIQVCVLCSCITSGHWKVGLPLLLGRQPWQRVHSRPRAQCDTETDGESKHVCNLGTAHRISRPQGEHLHSFTL